MARSNTRESSAITGQLAPSPLSSRAHSANPRTGVTHKGRALTPGSSSEKENPRSRLDKGKAPAPASARASAHPPTPESAESLAFSNNNGRSMTRKRRAAFDEAEPLSDDDGGVLGEDDGTDISSPSSSAHDPDDLLDVTDAGRLNDSGVSAGGSTAGPRKRARIFDPNQDEVERRVIKGKSRALEREFNENRDTYMRLDNGQIAQIIERADDNFGGVKQTTDGTIDSRLMVSVSDLTHRKSARLVAADGATGIDVDDYVSKCIAFMRRAASRDIVQRSNNTTSSSTQRRRRTAREEADDDNDDDNANADEALDWAHLGQQACFPYNSRPAVSSFLLGPLSLQRRVRAPTQRRSRQQREAEQNRAETRPEALQGRDFDASASSSAANAETSTVRHVCGKIKARLLQHCRVAEARVQAAVEALEDGGEWNDGGGGGRVGAEERGMPTDAQISRIMRKERVTRTGGPSLFDFVVNPHSFGQTVENLFYVSFLIKEGEVGVQMDDDGLPALVPNQESIGEARERNRARHQAVFSIDFATWQSLKEAFDIRCPLIPHREEGVPSVGARGWY